MADNLKGIPFASSNEASSDEADFIVIAKLCVVKNYNQFGIGTQRGEKIDPLRFGDVHVVWFSFVRGNWKAVLATSRPDGRIYEVSYKRGDDGFERAGSLVCDTYLKTHNIDMTGLVF